MSFTSERASTGRSIAVSTPPASSCPRSGQLPPACGHQRGASGVPRRPQGRLLRQQLRRLRRATSGVPRCLGAGDRARTWRAPTVSGRRCGPGATTIMDVGTMPGGPAAFTKIAGELGVRAHVGPAFRSASYAFDGSRIVWEWDEAAGVARLERAVAYIKEHDGALQRPDQGHALSRPARHVHAGSLAAGPAVGRRPRRADTAARRDEASASSTTSSSSMARRRSSSCHSIRFLKPRTGLGHCVFHNEHSWCHYPYADDLKLLADSGVTVVHAPYKYANDGRASSSRSSAIARSGINIALRYRHVPARSDPRDALGRLDVPDGRRKLSRWAGRRMSSTRPRSAARATSGRDDLGRLAPGAKADIIVVDLRHLHYGAVHDPDQGAGRVAADGRDVETVIVDGQMLVEGGRAAACRRADALLRDAQSWKASGSGTPIPQWHWTAQAARRHRAAELPDPPRRVAVGAAGSPAPASEASRERIAASSPWSTDGPRRSAQEPRLLQGSFDQRRNVALAVAERGDTVRESRRRASAPGARRAAPRARRARESPRRRDAHQLGARAGAARATSRT
mgnify:CR=1 FL=1